MQHLRIVGVEAEGENPQLLLSDEAGAEYALPIDEALKSAVARRHSPAAQRSGGSSTTPFAPREIQARLRAGATVEEVVEASGLSEQHVLRYAGPVADERAFYASRARQTVVARASTAENHRMAFGDAPATLEDMVNVRLRAVGVNLRTVTWDAWRREDGLWAVFASFDTGSSVTQAAAIGQQPPAEWVFDPGGRAVRAVNKWAESLISLPAATAKQRSGRRLAAVDEPFDVDETTAARPAAAARTSRSPRTGAAESGGESADHEDLLDILRARRGQRLGSDESGDDKLATLLTREEPHSSGDAPDLRAVTSTEKGSASSSEKTRKHDVDQEGDADGHAGGDAESGYTESGDSEHGDPEAGDAEPGGTDAWGFSYADSGDDEGAGSAEAAQESADEPAAQAPAAKKKSSSRRPTMPKWDDILFGSKNE